MGHHKKKNKGSINQMYCRVFNLICFFCTDRCKKKRGRYVPKLPLNVCHVYIKVNVLYRYILMDDFPLHETPTWQKIQN